MIGGFENPFKNQFSNWMSGEYDCVRFYSWLRGGGSGVCFFIVVVTEVGGMEKD